MAAKQEQRVGIDAIGSSDYRNFLPWPMSLTDHAQLLRWVPAPSQFLAKNIHIFIVVTHHKHHRLPVPFRKGERCPVFIGA
jgi:hypothetical protein